MYIVISLFIVFLVKKTVSNFQLQSITITIGNPNNQTGTITVTPSIGQSVELRCDNGTRFKQWYTTGSEVMPTPCDVSTRSGPTRILAFSSFTPSHAGTYTCLASTTGDTQTKTTYPVVLGKLSYQRVR